MDGQKNKKFFYQPQDTKYSQLRSLSYALTNTTNNDLSPSCSQVQFYYLLVQLKGEAGFGQANYWPYHAK